MPVGKSPAIVADYLKPYVEGKTYCEFGCGAGIVLRQVQEFAKKAIGVEINDYSKQHEGMTIIKADIFDIDIPEAEVYYCWITHNINRRIYNRIQKGLFIIGAEEFVEEETALLEELKPEKLIKFEFNEGDSHRQSGTFYLGLFYK